VRLALIHQTPGTAPCPPGAAWWQTCLRDVFFVRDAPADRSNDALVTDGDAYAVLLEVVCGLRSPLAGETEVQAQFKAFLGSLDARADGDLLRVGQRVLADAKSIRQRYLQGVGVVAYGPLVVRFVPAGRRVVLVGTGALAADLSAALAGRHEIHHWGRKPGDGRPRYSMLSAAALGTVLSTEAVTLIVAAPVPQADVDALAVCYPRIFEVIDLRGRHERQTPTGSYRLITLDELFREAAHLGPGAGRIAAARREIRELSLAFAERDELRPFGWDDLCA
jgi:glutamyl-tRNA reductase